MCVEAAVCYALGLPHGDNPDKCVAQSVRVAKIVLNDSFIENKARTKGLRKLSILQLGTYEVLDEVEFTARVTLLVINKYLPPLLRKESLNKEADACEQARDLKEARAVAAMAAMAANAAFNAADAAKAAVRTANIASAVNAAVNAAAVAADSDKVLTEFAEDIAQILISMCVPGVKWLDLL